MPTITTDAEVLALVGRCEALHAALRTYREHPANHIFCLHGIGIHGEYDNRCMVCVRADEALEAGK